MKAKRAKLATAALAMASLSAAPQAAGAFVGTPAGGCDCVSIQKFHQKTVAALSSRVEESATQTRDELADRIEDSGSRTRERIDASAERIVEGLRGLSGEQSAYQDKQIEAAKRIADGVEQNHSVRLRQEFRARAESGQFDPNPTSCLLADLYEPVPEEKRARYAESPVAGMARTWLTAEDEDVAAGGARLAARIAGEKELHEGFEGSENPTADWGLLVGRPTVDFSDGQMAEVGSRIVINGVNPSPPRPISERELQTPLGVAKAAARQKAEARQQAALEAIDAVLGMRSAAASSAPFMPYVDDSAYSREVPDMISALQQLDIRSSRHYAPVGAVAAQRETKPERAMLQEILDAVAINARINYHRLELESRTAIVLALVLATLNDSGPR